MVELEKADLMPGWLFNPRTRMYGLLQGDLHQCIKNWQGR